MESLLLVYCTEFGPSIIRFGTIHEMYIVRYSIDEAAAELQLLFTGCYAC